MAVINNLSDDHSAYTVTDDTKKFGDEVCFGTIEEIAGEKLTRYLNPQSTGGIPEYYKIAFNTSATFRQHDGSVIIHKHPDQIIEGTEYLWLIFSGGVSDTYTEQITQITDMIEASRRSYCTQGVVAIRKSNCTVFRCLDPFDTGAVKRIPGDLTSYYKAIKQNDGTVTWKKGWHDVKGEDESVSTKTYWFIDTQTATKYGDFDTYFPFTQEAPYQVFGHPHDAYPLVTTVPVLAYMDDEIFDAEEIPTEVECLILIGGFLKNGFLDNENYRKEHAAYTIRTFIPTFVKTKYDAHSSRTIDTKNVLSVSVFRNTQAPVWNQSVLHAGIGTSGCAVGNIIHMYGGLQYSGKYEKEYEKIDISSSSQYTSFSIHAQVDGVLRVEGTAATEPQKLPTGVSYLLRIHPDEQINRSVGHFKIGEWGDCNEINYGNENKKYDPRNHKYTPITALYPYIFPVGDRICVYGGIGLDLTYTAKCSFPLTHKLMVGFDRIPINIPVQWMSYTSINPKSQSIHRRPLNISGDIGALEGMCPIQISNKQLLLMGGLDADRHLLGRNYPIDKDPWLEPLGSDEGVKYSSASFNPGIQVMWIDDDNMFGYQPYSIIIDEECMRDNRPLIDRRITDPRVNITMCTTPFRFSTSTTLYDCWYSDVIPFPEKDRWLLFGSLLNEPVFPYAGEVRKFYTQPPPVTMIQLMKRDRVYDIPQTSTDTHPNYSEIFHNMIDVLSGELVNKVTNSSGVSLNPSIVYQRELRYMPDPELGRIIGNRLGHNIICKDMESDTRYWLFILDSFKKITCYRIELEPTYYAEETNIKIKLPPKKEEQSIFGTGVNDSNITYRAYQ